MIDESRIAAALKADADKIAPTPDLLNRIKRQAAPQPWYRKALRAPRIRRAALSAVAVAAGVLVFTAVIPFPGGQPNVVLAMEKAASQLKSYHGVMADGTEVWRAGAQWRVRYPDGKLYLVNEAEFWQEYVDQQKAYVLEAKVADNLEVHLDLARIAAMALQHPHEMVGTESVAGRMTTKIRVKLSDDHSSHIWIDNEFNLPLQWEIPYRRGTPVLVTFTSFEVNEPIDPALFTYQPPQGYEVVDLRERIVTAETAESVTGFTPLMPRDEPLKITASDQHVRLDYGTVSILQYPSREPMQMWGQGAYGSAAGGLLRVTRSELEWEQNGLRITVSTQSPDDDRYIELARQIAPDLKLPDPNQDLVGAAQVQVEVNMDEARALQDKMDQGDPMRGTYSDAEGVAVTWAVEEADQRNKPISGFEVVANTGVQAIIDVQEGPYARIYLKKLVRPENDGIWFVVGYDPR